MAATPRPARAELDAATFDDVAAILFDLDGTLVDSILATERAYATWGREAGLADYRHTGHGETAAAIVARHVEPSRREESLRRIVELESADVAGVVAIEGALALLETLPAHAWAIVTSCGPEVAAARLTAAGIPAPRVLVTADLVTRSKPDPEGYLLAARRLGVDIARCVAVEDTPVGLRAAHDSGARSVAVSGTYPASVLAAQSTADVVVGSVADLTVAVREDGSLQVSAIATAS